MSKYIINVELEYGVFNSTAETYDELKMKFNQIKKQFEGTSCAIHCTNVETGKAVWAPTKPEPDAIDRWNTLIDAIYDIQKAQIKLVEEHKELDKIVHDSNKQERSDIYHELELMNLAEMTPDEIMKWVEEKKLILNKRRSVKKEMARYAVMQATINSLIDLISENYKYLNFEYANKHCKRAAARKYDLEEIENLYK